MSKRTNGRFTPPSRGIRTRNSALALGAAVLSSGLTLGVEAGASPAKPPVSSAQTFYACIDTNENEIIGVEAMPFSPQFCSGSGETTVVTQITGAQGVVGAQGAQGYQGNQGVQGTGAPGVQGNQGNNGSQGFQGAQGVVGAGTQGSQGYQGKVGTNGPQGNQGNIGNTGIQGNQGLRGVQGAQGFQGAQGAQGTQGNNGSQGFQGAQGVVGAGAQGSQGFQGYQGFQGVAGTGAQGAQGAQGLQGPQSAGGFTAIPTTTSISFLCSVGGASPVMTSQTITPFVATPDGRIFMGTAYSTGNLSQTIAVTDVVAGTYEVGFETDLTTVQFSTYGSCLVSPSAGGLTLVTVPIAASSFASQQFITPYIFGGLGNP
jgi:hypothetical protein